MEYKTREGILIFKKDKEIRYVRMPKCQAEVMEILIMMNGEPIKGPQILQEIEKKRGVTLYKNNVTLHIKRINEKTNGLIKNRHGYGYYIDEEIKIY